MTQKQYLTKSASFLAVRGMNVSEKKTKLTATTDGFDFLGWHFKVQSNGKFRCIPSVDNFKAFRQKVKHIVNNSNYGATTKAEKLSLVVRGWRVYHRFCKMDGSRFSLWHIQNRAFKVFNKETKRNRYTSKKLLDKAFPSVPYSESKFVNVKGEKSPFDGDIAYWSERNSKLYDGDTSKALKRQNHSCGYCGLKMLSDEKVHLHHVDGNHSNWKTKNLIAVHQSCHMYKHMSKSAHLRTSGAGCRENGTSRSNWEGQGIISLLDPTHSPLTSMYVSSTRACVISGFQVWSASLVQFWSISLNPTIHRRMVYSQPTLQHHLLQVAVRERIALSPSGHITG